MQGHTEQDSDCAIVPNIITTEGSMGVASNTALPREHPPQAGPDEPRAQESAPFDVQAGESNHKHYVEIDSMTLSDFVRYKFIPEYVEARRPASRAHFRAILKYLISPAQHTPARAHGPRHATVKSRRTRSWPYLGSLPLRAIDEGRIRHLTNVALESGYSIQTATHIRNVIRAIFSYASIAYCYTGTNPTHGVELPAMARRETRSLTLLQVKQLIPAMRHPEKAMALLALLTDLNVAEICGLQWQFANISANGALVQGEWIPPKTIAVRKQFYRGEFGTVSEGRNRLLQMPETLLSMLRDMRTRRRFTDPNDFVVASRTGTPVHPENIAARRLKVLGRAHDMPWLSWSAFRRANRRLRSDLELHLQKNASSQRR